VNNVRCGFCLKPLDEIEDFGRHLDEECPWVQAGPLPDEHQMLTNGLPISDGNPPVEWME
jgi:hypothetical protein